MSGVIQDLRFALRQLRKTPGFTAVAILTLALGIGANTALFSVVNAVLRHPAGVDHPERVVVLHTRYTRFTLDIPGVSAPNYITVASLRDQVEAAAGESSTNFNILHDREAEHISAASVSSKWFQVFGAQPILGRTFTPEEDQPNAGPVVVLRCVSSLTLGAAVLLAVGLFAGAIPALRAARVDVMQALRNE